MIPILPLKRLGSGKVFTPNVQKAGQSTANANKTIAKELDRAQLAPKDSSPANDIFSDQSITFLQPLPSLHAPQSSSISSHITPMPPPAPKQPAATAATSSSRSPAPTSLPSSADILLSLDSAEIHNSLSRPLDNTDSAYFEEPSSSSNTNNSSSRSRVARKRLRRSADSTTRLTSSTPAKPRTVPTSSSKKLPPTIFPPLYGEVTSYERIIFYAKKSVNGVEGIVLSNVHDRAVISHLDPNDMMLQGKLRVGDVVLSVNATDARYVKFQAVLEAVSAPGQPDEKDHDSSQRLLDGTPGVLLRNKTNEDKMICIVFARPQNLDALLPSILPIFSVE